ncbi:MAG: efflux RND transporter periplasmic adaptor subunit [Lentisphaeria bacterium]|nr:efflux RND transporter periplasmic adaptor subunit [Lentisphaeria bacterium]
MRLAKYPLPLLLGMAALLGAGTGCGREKAAPAERVTRVTVGHLESRTFRRQIPVQGTVTPVERATISAKINGTLEVLKVDEGDRRKAGDFLFGIDSQVLKNQVVVKEDEINVKEAALKTAEFALRTAEINCAQTRHDYERALTLRESKAVSLASFENAETAYKRAQTVVQSAQAEIANAASQLKQARSNLAIARKNLEDSIIKAPFDCVVTEKFVEENEFVTVGQDILKLENPDRLEVVCHISAVYYPAIEPGRTPAEFIRVSGAVAGRAAVTWKAPAVDPESRTFKIKIAVPKTLRLVSGMLCELRVILEEKTNYGLPADAVLLRANNRSIAFTVNDRNRAESVEIVRGITSDNWCEVLNAGDLVGRRFVIGGQTFLNNGAPLAVTSGGGKR